MTPKVSILIPVYNVDKYLNQFLQSLVNQTLKEIEIIIINDCSPDNSHNIILNYLDDPRIIYKQKEINEGPEIARQEAFLISKGEYVINMDPDDYIDLNFFEELYNLGYKNNLDVVQSNVTIVDENNIPIKGRGLKSTDAQKILTKDDDYSILLASTYASWFRLAKKTHLERFNYIFPEGELTLFSYLFCDNVRVGIHPEVHYYYRKHSTSLSTYGKRSKTLNEKGIFNLEKIKNLTNIKKNLPISSEKKRDMLNLYVYKSQYSLTMISWLESKPPKEYKNNVSKIFKKEYGLNLSSILKYLNYFDNHAKLFLLMTYLKLESLILYKFKSKM